MGSLMRMSEHGIEPLQGLERAPLHVFDGPAIVLDHVDGVVAFDRSRMRVARGSAPSDAKGSTLVSTVTAGRLFRPRLHHFAIHSLPVALSSKRSSDT